MSRIIVKQDRSSFRMPARKRHPWRVRKIHPWQVRKIPRPHPNPEVEWHLQMYDKIDIMSYDMHVIRKPTLLNLSNDSLRTLGITIGP